MRARCNNELSATLTVSVLLAFCSLCLGQTGSDEANSAPSPEVIAFFQRENQIFTSNLVSYLHLERTNPALAKVVAEQRVLERRLLEVNAHHAITYLQDFGFLFPTNTDYWHYSWKRPGERLWTIQTGLYGRCLLQMNVPFEVDSTQTNILKWDPPTLLLIAYADPPPDRKDFCRGYEELSRRTFTISDWTNLVRAGGDLSVLSYTGPTNRPLFNFDAQWRFRKW